METLNPMINNYAGIHQNEQRRENKYENQQNNINNMNNSNINNINSNNINNNNINNNNINNNTNNNYVNNTSLENNRDLNNTTINNYSENNNISMLNNLNNTSNSNDNSANEHAQLFLRLKNDLIQIPILKQKVQQQDLTIQQLRQQLQQVLQPAHGFLEPRTYVSECGLYIFIEIELPGVSKENVKVTFFDSILTITGTKNSSYQLFEEELTQRNPKSNGVYKRVLKIKLDSVTSNSFKFKFIDGVLFIRVTKPSTPANIEDEPTNIINNITTPNNISEIETISPNPINIEDSAPMNI